MENIDLDNILDQTRKSIRLTSEIDIDDKFEEVSIGRIMDEIKAQTDTMVESNEYIQPKEYVRVLSNNESNKIILLKKIDNKLRKISLYEYRIRPTLRKKVDYIYNRKIIDGRELFKFEDEEFVDVLYRSILFREADFEGKENALQFLRKTGSDKIDLIYNFTQSDEAKFKNLSVKGIKGRKIYLSVKRKLISFPILGYVLRLGINICLLPNRLRNFQGAFDDIYNQVRLLNTRSYNIEQNLNNVNDRAYCSEQNINELVEQKNNSEQNIKELVERKNNSEQNIKELVNKTNNIEIGISNFDNTVRELMTNVNKELDHINQRTHVIEQFKIDSTKMQEDVVNRQKAEKEIMDKFYLRYNEVLMPDSREDVKNRAKVYIDKLNNWVQGKNKNVLNVIDLGCGECEWIELLSENGFPAKGVDSNSAVVKKVKNTFPNISIEEIDAFSYLKRLEDNSVDLLSSFHMVEHLDMMDLIVLLAECKRVLKKGGMLIAETPNPQNILTSTYYFNMDPTHKKPIPPELLVFFVNESGLKVEEKVLLYPLSFVPYEYKENDPIKDIVFRFNMEQAYSVLAVKE